MAKRKHLYPAVAHNVAFEKWAVAADHALLAARWAIGDQRCIDIADLIDQARELLGDGRAERP